MYTISTAKAAEGGSDGWARVTKANYDRPNIRKTDATRFARSCVFQSHLSRFCGILRRAKLFSKMKFTSMALSYIFSFTAISVNATMVEEKGNNERG